MNYYCFFVKPNKSAGKVMQQNSALDKWLAQSALGGANQSLTLNETLVESSILLAHAYDVEVSKILKDEVDLERFLFG